MGILGAAGGGSRRDMAPTDLSHLSIEERSNVEERKLTILADYARYMEDHPEVRQVLNDFICACMTEKPKNVYKFARYWFKHSLPPLDALSTAGSPPKTAAPEPEPEPEPAPEPEEQTLEKIKRIAPRRLLARIYSTIDSNSGQNITKKEFQFSPLWGVWPEEVWERMDADHSGGVTPVEFFAFMASVEADEGKEKFAETVANFVWEADIHVMDLLPPAEGVREKVEVVQEKKLRQYLFKEAIHQGSGEKDREYITKAEMQYSKIGQMCLPYWKYLDASNDGQVSITEWNAFFDKLQSEMNSRLSVEMFLEGGYDLL